MKLFLLSCVLALTSVALLTNPASAQSSTANGPAQYADAAIERVKPAHMAEYHDLLASEPHLAGTPGDARTIERIESLMRSFGLSVERQNLWVYLSSPVDASVTVLPQGEVPINLPLREEPLAEDEWSHNDNLPIGFNGYAGTGDVTAEVVYANYGRLEDFQELKKLGIDCTGKIVIARYGGNFRGYKAKFAQEAGAAGLIIYTDPADSGFAKGIPYPEGGYSNDSSIQRGSLATLEYSGDPLTPFIEATKDAKRLDPDDVALPKIPVQPIGWGAAKEIISRMKGQRVPDAWQGGVEAAYRLSGGPNLRVRLKVTQDRGIRETANVIGELRGSTYPDEIILVGCHHDAWGYGASDPLAGMICLLEAARSFGELAREGWQPARTIRFAAWAAEEHGIIGSTEYAEAHAEELRRSAVAYINLDMAAMGPNFEASGTPSLTAVVAQAAAAVPQPGIAKSTVLDTWLARKPGLDSRGNPRLGDLGGGSDHVAFNCHLAVPSLGMSAHGSKGTAYHANYDTLHWYRQVVGHDYQPAVMIASMTIGVVARLAESKILPLDPSTYAEHTERHLDALQTRVSLDGLASLTQVRAAAVAFGDAARPVMDRLNDTDLTDEQIREVNAHLMAIERRWADGFETGRSWFRSGFASSDQSSGYAAWMLPPLRHAIELDDNALLRERVRSYERYFESASDHIDAIRQVLD